MKSRWNCTTRAFSSVVCCVPESPMRKMASCGNGRPASARPKFRSPVTHAPEFSSGSTAALGLVQAVPM